jgi:hypothetical protein
MNFFSHDPSRGTRANLELTEAARQMILDFQMLDWFWFEEHPGATVRRRPPNQVEIDLLGFEPAAVVAVHFDGQKIRTTNKPEGV